MCKVSLGHYGLVRIPESSYFIEFKAAKLNRIVRFLAPKILINKTNTPIYCKRVFPNESPEEVEHMIEAKGLLPLDGYVGFQISLNKRSYS